MTRLPGVGPDPHAGIEPVQPAGMPPHGDHLAGTQVPGGEVVTYNTAAATCS